MSDPDGADPDGGRPSAVSTGSEASDEDRTSADDAEPVDDDAEPVDDDAEPVDDDAEPVAEDTEPEWWDDPRMPWKGKPGRADLLCWGGFALSGIYSLVLLPFRPKLIGTHPLLLAGLTGSRSAVVTIGALTAVGRFDLWWVGLILATISVMKFDPLFWWAGRLWGDGLVQVIAGRSPRAARNARRAERWAQRWGIPAMLLTYVVPVVPTAVVYATVGAAGMRLRTFLLVDLLGAFATRAGYLYLGYRLGQRAVTVIDTIARYSTYLSLALVALIIIGSIRQGRRARARTEDRETATGPAR